MNVVWTFLSSILYSAAPTPGASLAGWFVGLLRRKGGVSVDIPILRTGYVAPQPPVGLRNSRDLSLCEPELQKRYASAMVEFETMTGHQLFVTRTYCEAAEQSELYAIGRRGIPDERIVTNCDGYASRSRHQDWPSSALDVAVDLDPGPGQKVSWAASDYAPLGPICARHGLEWGGNFKDFDGPHIQLPPGATT